MAKTSLLSSFGMFNRSSSSSKAKNEAMGNRTVALDTWTTLIEPTRAVVASGAAPPVAREGGSPLLPRSHYSGDDDDDDDRGGDDDDRGGGGDDETFLLYESIASARPPMDIKFENLSLRLRSNGTMGVGSRGPLVLRGVTGEFRAGIVAERMGHCGGWSKT